MRPFTVDDLLKLNQFAHRCPWDLSPDGELLAVTLSEANRREPLGDGSSVPARSTASILKRMVPTSSCSTRRPANR